MRAISLWQPWASAVALGSKRIETRSWSTNYRGPLAIHAAARKVTSELIQYSCEWPFRGALMPLAPPGMSFTTCLPFGAIVGVVELIECRPTEDITGRSLDFFSYPAGDKSECYRWTERYLGDYSMGRFGWVLANARALKTPVPFKGHQGFFNVPDELVTT